MDLILNGDPELWAIVSLSLLVMLSATILSAVVGMPNRMGEPVTVS